ncbi:MAG: AsmA [Micavibrio sp.]|nr:AsmA [Micavibrio sp.]
MKKLVVILGGIVVVVLVGAVAAPHMIDWNKYKPRIQSAVAEFTGYEVNLAGDIDMAVLPFPHVVIENVGVKIPGAAKDIVGLKKAEVSVALMPLFSGELSVSSVNLVDPVINLVVDKDGRKTWMTEKMQGSGNPQNAASAPGTQGGGGKFALNKMQIENGTLNYTDATGKTTTIEKINTTLSADSLSGPFTAKGDVTYNNQKISADVKTGKMDAVAKTVSLEATIKLPGEGIVSYAGIAGTAGGIDLQGETKIMADNISALMTAVSGTASTLPPVALNIQGIVTAKDTQTDIKNLKIVLGDFQASGAIGIRNLKAQDGPAQATIDLTSNKAFKLESLMPGKSVKTVQAAPDKDVPKGGTLKSFLPDSFKLPLPVDVQGMINLAGVSYKGAEFGVIKIGIDKKGGVIALTEDVGQIPGGGAISGKSTLAYGAGSQGADKAGVVYSDPSLTYSMKMNAKAPSQLFGAFLPADKVKSMQQVLKDPIAFDGNGTVRGVKAGVENGTLSIGSTVLNLGATSYTLDQTGKNDVVLTVSGQNINLDAFMGAKQAAPAAVAAPATPGVTVTPAASSAALQDTLKKLDLPVDLTVRADLKNVTMQGANYAAVTIDGALTGNNLTLKTASMQDPQGNVMQASGGVKDIHALSGVDVTLSGKTADANAFLKSLKVDTAKLPKDIGPLDLAVSLTGDKPDSLAFNAKAKVFDGDASANGMLLKALSEKPAVDKLAVSITNPNFEKLFQKFSPGYKAGVGINKSMNVTANVNLTGDGYDVSAVTATLGSMTVTGSVKAKTGGTKPDITATFSAGTIPLDILMGKDKAPPPAVPGTSKVIASNGSGERWSRDPIDASVLNDFNLDLKLNAKSIQYGNWDLTNTVLAVTVKEGSLNIAQMDAGVYGGTMSLTSTIKAGAKKGDALTFETKSDFKNVALEPMAAAFGGGTKLIKARGNVSLSLNAKSSGTSPATLVGGLNGGGQMDGKNVVLQGFDLAAMSRSLVSTGKVVDNITGLAGASFSGGETAFEKIDGPFTISSGVIGFDKFLMTGATATILNKGTISLPRWYVDMVSSIDLVEPADAPNLDMKFQGSLDNPGNTFGSNAMQSYIQGRVSKKLQSIVGDKLGDKNPALNNLVNGLLGGKPAEAPAVAPAATTSGGAAVNPVVTTTVTPEAAAAPPAPAAGETTNAPEPAAPAAKPTREEKINNVLQGIMGATGH